MDPDEFEEEFSVKQPQKNDINIVFHCFAGVRSRAAMEAVHQISNSVHNICPHLVTHCNS